MANAWEELENRCYEYLRHMYGDNNSIEPYGKSDSTKADIKVEPAASDEFFVEVKAGDSQCCQFVLFPNEDTESFDFQKETKSHYLIIVKELLRIWMDYIRNITKSVKREFL